VDCVYCGTPQPRAQGTERKRSVIKQMLYKPPTHNTAEIPVNCICGKEYHLTQIGDRNYWRNNITEDKGVMESLKRKIADDTIDFDRVIASMTGIARQANGSYHICFNICNIRGYFDCIRGNGVKMFSMVSVWRTC
jgi:hypothetical protein